MEELIMAIVIAVVGAIAGALGMYKAKSDSTPVNPQTEVSRPSKKESIKEDAEKEKEKVHKEIKDESNHTIVKRFFDAFSRKPSGKSRK